MRKILLIIGLAAGCSGAEEPNRLSEYAMTDDSMQQWKLPGKLREISGLALAPDGRLFAVADESAVIYEIDYAYGGLLKAFAMGDPVIRGDFEGIAWLDDSVYVTTSDGLLYTSAEGRDGERVEATSFDTGLGAYCELEGLTSRTKDARLFFVCKDMRQGGASSGLMIFEWSVADRKLVGSIRIPLASIERALGMNNFNPSGIAIDPERNHFLVVAARQRSLAEIGPDGGFIAARRFRQPGRHRQAEGIELTSDGRLLIADEGGDKKARLAVYEPRQRGESR